MSLITTPRQLNQRGELYHQLGMMLAAGLPIRKALEHLQTNPPAIGMRKSITQWLEQLDNGLTVTEALRKSGKWMPSFDIALIDAAEQSGRLDACFKLMSIYYQERAQMARQMISDMIYPAFLFNFAIVLFPLVDLVVHGNFARFFWTIGIIAVPLYSAIFLMIYACQGRHGEPWRAAMEKILANVPVLGNARHNLVLARLVMALESLLNAGVPIVTAWELSATASGSPALDKTVKSWKPRLENGASFSELVSSSDQFPDLFRNLYHTGEVSGTLDNSLNRLHTLYQTEGLRKMRALSQWTPKLVYFGVLLFAAWKIVSFYAGLYGPGSDLGRVLDGK